MSDYILKKVFGQGGRMKLTIKGIAPYIGSEQFLEIKKFDPNHKGKRLLYKRITIDTDVAELCKPYENMEVYIQDWINKLDKVIDNYQEKVNNINAEHGTEKVIICTFSFNWENSGDNSNLVTYKKVRYLNNIFLAELNDIRFGIDLNLFTTQKYFTAEDTLDFMVGLHEEYEEEHAEENHRYYMNTIEDAEIIKTYYKK